MLKYSLLCVCVVVWCLSDSSNGMSDTESESECTLVNTSTYSLPSPLYTDATSQSTVDSQSQFTPETEWGSESMDAVAATYSSESDYSESPTCSDLEDLYESFCSESEASNSFVSQRMGGAAEHDDTSNISSESVDCGRLTAALEPLYEAADITVFHSYLLIFQFVIRHNLSTKAFSELIHLIAIHLPKAARLPKSVHKLKQFFNEIFPDVHSQVHSYCSCCHNLLPSALSRCERNQCRDSCNEQFISVPLAPQLKRKVEDPNTWKALQQRFTRHAHPDLIQDIYDGLEYRKHSSFLSIPSNVSLMLNTDGVAIFRSSKRALWPVWLVVNELPRHMRFIKKNMILAAMWLSKEKPTMTTFLRPVLDSINDLYIHGISVQTPSGQMKAHAVLLLNSVDLPARAILLNMKQFNGQYACCYCEDQGDTPPRNYLHRFWPPSGCPVLRTHLSLMANAKDALRHGNAVKGVKGPSILAIHHPFNVVNGTAIDVLHAVFLGVTHHLLKLWLHKDHRQHDFYIGNKIDLCNQRLLRIQVPDVISRVPKGLDDLGHWKGSEFRSWILFFALPVLFGVLPALYFNHLSVLVASLHLLWGDTVSVRDVHFAKGLLLQFYTKFPELYGETSSTMNVHMLSHLHQCVLNWGPLWAYSCFSFESMNGQLKQMFHGSQDMTKQMAFSYVMLQMLPSIELRACQRIEVFHDLLSGKRKPIAKRLSVGHNIWALGGTSIFNPSQEVLEQLPSTAAASHQVRIFYRLEVNSQQYYSQRYRRVKKRNSHTILYVCNGQLRMGQILYFLYISPAAFAVVKRLHISNSSMLHFHLPLDILKQSILPVTTSSYTDVLPVENVKEKCLYLDVCSDCKYVARFPCTLVHDYVVLKCIYRMRRISGINAKMCDISQNSYASAEGALMRWARVGTNLRALSS